MNGLVMKEVQKKRKQELAQLNFLKGNRKDTIICTNNNLFAILKVEGRYPRIFENRISFLL